MQRFAQEYLRSLEGLHAEIDQILDTLPQAALDWSPGPEMNSIAVLAAHVAGSERYLIGDTIAQESSNRDRPAEFSTSTVEGAALKARLAASLEHARGVLETLTVQDLEAERIFPRDGRQVTVTWCLTHALQHTALHTGHMQITRQLWEQREQA